MKGSCDCGAIRFRVSGPAQDISFCNCGQCRKKPDCVWPSAFVEESQIEATGIPQSYALSKTAKRGFCETCGTFLFWKHNEESSISFALGAVDGRTGLNPEKNIFVADKGDYYEIADGVPQREN